MTMTWIAGQTASGGSTATITFNSIPSNFTHLQLRGFSRAVNAQTTDQIAIRLNGDTTIGNYSFHQLDGNGSAPDVYGQGGQYFFGIATTGGSSTAGMWGVGIVDLLDYTNTNKNKTLRSITGHDQNGSGRAGLRSGAWYSTSAVTSISMVNQTTGGFVDGSRFDLYGISTSDQTGA